MGIGNEADERVGSDPSLSVLAVSAGDEGRADQGWEQNREVGYLVLQWVLVLGAKWLKVDLVL
jgi:hypothetical protein